MNSFGEKEAWAYPGTAQFIWVPLLSQEWEKLRISYLASTFRGSIWIKAREKFWRKGSVGVSRGCPNFFGIPYFRNVKSYGFQVWNFHPNKSPLKILEKRERGRIQWLSNFLGTPIISWTAKAAIFKFCAHIYRLDRSKSPLKFSGKVAMGIVRDRDSRNFSGHPYIGHIARSSLRQLSFLVTLSINYVRSWLCTFRMKVY